MIKGGYIFFFIMVLLAGCRSGTATTVSATAGQEPQSVNCPLPQESTEMTDARLYIEYNATDGDLGVHGGFDDDGWSALCLFAPGGEQILGVEPQANLGELTLASIFFEGREPELTEFSFADLAAQFPEGSYEVRALSYEGIGLTGAATFSHKVPAEPHIVAPALAEDEETAVATLIPTTDLVVRWDNVTQTVNGDPTHISGYEVIITKVDHDDPHGYSRPIFDVHLLPDHNSLSVPPEFLQPDTVYELEVLALEESGNQTISVGFFQTE